ncbi:hypothetical protein D3P44_013625 [Stutzerimonas balearica]|uniref:hypothetical protein n=1 Tax=Stutzerimonas balearica TaxID=74829 RepID=UPI0020164092|nr:hypothetical protein [Stutzerimonas balearica]WAN08457.1 hypothetical protein D3P44_013625 [Stutzerimonas balearica]
MNRIEERIREIRRGVGSSAKSTPLASLARQEKSRGERGKATSQSMFLPGFALGAFPNHLNRSSLIAPIARNKRKEHSKTRMVTRRDCVLEYRGEQLDEADGDLIMALIAFAQPFPLGDPVLLNRKQLLRKIKRGVIGSSQYEWLYQSMKRLRQATLFLEALKPDGSTRYTVGMMESFNILKSLSYDNETYCYTLDPHWILMFGNREYSLIDWGKRLQIRRGLDMAKTLQRLIATSSDRVQRYALEGLKAQMAYGGRLRDFRDSLGRAVCELERLEIIARGCIQDSSRGKPQLVLWLPP